MVLIDQVLNGTVCVEYHCHFPCNVIRVGATIGEARTKIYSLYCYIHLDIFQEYVKHAKDSIQIQPDYTMYSK